MRVDIAIEATRGIERKLSRLYSELPQEPLPGLIAEIAHRA